MCFVMYDVCVEPPPGPGAWSHSTFQYNTRIAGNVLFHRANHLTSIDFFGGTCHVFVRGENFLRERFV